MFKQHKLYVSCITPEIIGPHDFAPLFTLTLQTPNYQNRQ